MNSLHTFFLSIKEKKNIPLNKVIILYGSSYPALFISSMITDLRNLKIWSFLEIIDSNSTPLDQLFFKLETTFLGSEGCYWVKNVDQLKQKEKTIFLNYVSRYQGKNTIIFWIKDEVPDSLKNKKAMVLEIPEWCDKEFFTLWTSVSGDKKIVQPLVAMIFQKQQRLHFDTVIILAHCFAIMDAALLSQFNHYIDHLLLADQSLFVLSDYFFRKKTNLFYQEWVRIAPHYPDIFWMSYWSEQMWKAYYSIYYMQQNNVVQAKKIAFRLPFSFLQTTWKQCDPVELRNAYNYLYAHEYALKNGNNVVGLDLFYTKFFLHHFTQKKSGSQEENKLLSL